MKHVMTKGEQVTRARKESRGSSVYDTGGSAKSDDDDDDDETGYETK